MNSLLHKFIVRLGQQKTAWLIFGFLLPFLSVNSQQIEGVEETGILYKYAHNIGATLHSRGLGINYRKGKHVTGYSFLMSDFSLLSMRDSKEIRTVNQFSDNNSGYIYGKLNSVWILRTGIGKQKTMNAKADKGGIEVSYGFYGGFSWAFVKPVYLTILYTNDQDGTQKRIERYDPLKHYPDNISGRASYFKGIKESSIVPGIYSSFLLNFEFGKNQEKLKILETGLTVDAYLRPIPMMAFNKSSNYFLTFFIRILYGKLWNRR
jgi:hypothetical protein